MTTNSLERSDTERLRMHHAFWLAIGGLLLAAVLTVFLVIHGGARVDESSEVVAIVGLFTSVTGTLVGAFFGLQVGSAHAESERRGRHNAEEHRRSAEEVTRRALAHLPPETAKDVLSALHQQSEVRARPGG